MSRPWILTALLVASTTLPAQEESRPRPAAEILRELQRQNERIVRLEAQLQQERAKGSGP